MNRIYKVIWSKVKHQYVVVSELAHRDGKQSSAASKSVRTLMAVLAVCGMATLGYGIQDSYAAVGATTSPYQYVATGQASINDATSDNSVYVERPWWQGGSYWTEPTEYYKDITVGDKTYRYVYTEANDGKAYWVREGYSINIVEDERFTGADPDTVIQYHKEDPNADDSGLVQSFQNVDKNLGVTTAHGDTLWSTSTGVYAGAVNSPTTEVTSGIPTGSQGNQFVINNGTTTVGKSTFTQYFREVNYNSKTGEYMYNGNPVDMSALRVVDGQIGVFLTSPNGDEVYTGDVFGVHNEILMTGTNENSDLVSYWGAEDIDPMTPIGSMPKYLFDEKFEKIDNDLVALHKDDIEEIQVAQAGSGGTIGLARFGGGLDVDGTVTVTSVSETGKDVQIQFTNDKGSFKVDAGSKVKGTTGEAFGDTLTGLSINGVNYKLGGGKSVTSGSINSDGTINLKQGEDGNTGITLSGKIHDYALDDQDKTATDGKVTLTGSDRYGNATYDITIDGLVTTDNVEETIAAKNNLKVTDGENGGWMITDSSQTDEDGQAKVFKNTTLDIKNSTSTPIGTSKENIYGQSFVISDTAGNMITINDIASAAKLQEVDSLAVKYGMKDGKVDYSTIQLMNPYTTTAEGHSGGTTITNVAYADIKGDGSAAVNVDLLKDTVADVTTTVTANEKHIATNQGDTADIKDGQFSVKDGKITLVEVDGNGNTTGNAVVIDNVAAASDLGDVTDIHEGLLNKDENGNTIDTSVVDAVNNLDDKVGDTQYKHDDGSDLKYVTAGDSVTEAIGDLDAAIGNATTIAGQHSSVSGSNNITVAPNGTNTAGGTDYKVTLNNHITLGDKAQGTYVDVNGEDGTVTASGNINAGSFATGNITINAASDDGTHTGTINGLSNTTWDANKVVSGQAATEDQLKAATEAAVQYDRNDKGEVDKGNISLGYTDDQGKQQYTQIHNVAAGSAPTDAVNVSQLSAVGNLAVNNYNNIQVLNGSINKLDNRIDRVGAGAAALAALHPLDFDPDAKWDFAAGYGNYRGANAVAVGAYYRPNEDVMFSVGGSMGGGENMVNAGVSLKIGAGSSNVTTSRVAMAKEIKSMRDIVAKQDAQIQKLTAMVNALVGIQSEPDTTTMFPDVPENHWAYEAVEAMAKSGLVKGYPDGEFKGDRTMTRYEFAQIVYNAIQAGAEVDARLVEEFKPELEYFHIATVAKDKDGNPTIERVRAN